MTAAIGMVTPGSEEALAGGTAQGSKEGAEEASILAASDPACKRFKTLQARFALAGHALVRTAAGEGPAPLYEVRWGWIKPLSSLDEAERFLAQIGGTSCDAATGAGNA